MTDEDKALVERVAMLPDGNAWPSTMELLCDLRDRIEAQADRIEALEEALAQQVKACFCLDCEMCSRHEQLLKETEQ